MFDREGVLCTIGHRSMSIHLYTMLALAYITVHTFLE